jgi:hypothetical protein
MDLEKEQEMNPGPFQVEITQPAQSAKAGSTFLPRSKGFYSGLSRTYPLPAEYIP